MRDFRRTVDSGDQRIVFDAAHGAFPAAVLLRNSEGEYEPLWKPGGGLCVTLPDGRIVRPSPETEPRVGTFDEAVKVEFSRLRFEDADGRAEPDFQGTLVYEIYPDGTVFVSHYFLVASDRAPALRDLKLAYAPDLEAYDEVRWAHLPWRVKVDGAIIQAQSPKRFLPRGETLERPGITPLVSFNGFRPGRESLYLEFFVESGATLSGRRGENATTVAWEGNSPKIEWNFQTVPVCKTKLALKFHGHWGWIAKFPPRTRHLPPLTMYHYMSKSARYPSAEDIRAMADSGAAVLALHEYWRSDLQNGGVPWDETLFAETVATAHDCGMRVAVYMRGNENSVVEEQCDWFDRHLERNWDGLYMDYGGPCCHTTAPNEFFCDGRIRFRAHYRLFREMRRKIGPDALFYSHTGPFYSGMSMGFFDGYVSGEGERGLLIRSRRHHEYFSMAAVSPGTMWTAAFPEYSTERMIPFLAAAGQYPHVPLGEASESSSLTHPREPGIDDAAFRPLWKLWGMVKAEKDLEVRNDFNCRGVFPVDPECGHHLLFTADGERALCIVTNFAETERPFDVAPDWRRAGFDPEGKSVWLLTPDATSPGTEQLHTGKPLRVTLKPNAVAGFYFSSSMPDFAEYRKPYHKPCASGVKFLEELAEQRRLREDPPRWDKTVLTVSLPRQTVFGYEDSLILDLFANDSFLVRFLPDGSPEKLRPILTADGKSLFCGDDSAPIVLNELLPSGRHHLGICATHEGEPFYSFFTVTLGNGAGESYKLLFRNELEPDRAFLHFDVILP